MATAKQIDFLLVGLHKTDGTINSAGVVTFFESGTSTPKNAFDGPDTVTDNAITSVTLDATGKAVVYGNGTYRIVIKDSDGATIGTYDGMEYAVSSDTLNNVVSIANSDSPYAVSTTEHTIQANATGGAITVDLPNAAGNGGRTYYIKKTDSSANAITVDPNGAQTIDGATSYSLGNQYDWLLIESDGSNWTIVSADNVDVIDERTAATGVTVDGVLIKDNKVTASGGVDAGTSPGVITDVISEKTGAAGVTIDSFKIKDNAPDPTGWPSFRAYLSATQTNITGIDQIEFNSITTYGWDTNSDYNTSTFRFTPTAGVASYFHFEIGFAPVNAVAGDIINLFLYKNGSSELVSQARAPSSGVFKLELSGDSSSNGSTDYFEVFLLNNSRDTMDINIATAGRDSWFSGTRIA